MAVHGKGNKITVETDDSSSPYLDFHGGSEGHAELVVEILTEDSLEGLLEKRGVEGVSHYNVPPKTEDRQGEHVRLCDIKSFIKMNQKSNAGPDTSIGQLEL